MKYFFRLLGIVLILLSCLALNAANESKKTALLLEINGAIGPATQSFIQRGINSAVKQNAALIILQINTPGGLGTAMRGIVSDILASPIPVVAYVAPSGARAASAGTFILYASHIAAMAPGTHLGAATPVNIIAPTTETSNKQKIPDAEEKKALNDARAYIRSLAQLRGRNVQWGEEAVSQAASLSADEALKMDVIEVIANDVPDLLKKINGRKLVMQGQTQTLDTTNLNIQMLQPDWRTKFLGIITDPNIAYILLMIGIWGLFFEFSNPGFILPGVAGAICLLLALYALQLLPINYVGLGLILLGIIFLVAEAFVSSFGVLAVGAVIALIIGSIMLLETGTPGYRIAMPLILAVSGATVAFFVVVINLALKSRFRPIVSGREELLGSTGTVIMDENNNPRVRIHGELWQVQADVPLTAGQKVLVKKVEGLTLLVEPISEKKDNMSS